MNFNRISLSQFFKKQISLATDADIDPAGGQQTDPKDEPTDPDSPDPAPEPEPQSTETTDPAPEPEPETTSQANQAAIDVLTKELNLFGSTPDARAAFRTEAQRNKGFVEALKDVGIVSEDDTTTNSETASGRRSYEAAPWNKKAIEKRSK